MLAKRHCHGAQQNVIPDGPFITAEDKPPPYKGFKILRTIMTLAHPLPGLSLSKSAPHFSDTQGGVARASPEGSGFFCGIMAMLEKQHCHGAKRNVIL